jgi:hypothetical protein
MSKAPDRCRYCDGEGNSSAGGPCGFCANGVPLDTQEDWDNSWGRAFDLLDSGQLESAVSSEPTSTSDSSIGPN